ncbi:hypothetical protein ACFQS1_16055 [Paractinoplanes rhizophilus]|uniref:Uncharacterized protein n=1 Tax=Paractinoplanes rhizophilus TaxID=1416877 RepID=A0ABW2HTR3_9ACTN
MPAYENGRPAITSSPSHSTGQAVVPADGKALAYNRRQDLTLAYGLKPPPPVEVPDKVKVVAQVLTPELAPHPANPDPRPAPAPDPAPQPTPAPRPAPRPRPPAEAKRAGGQKAEANRAAANRADVKAPEPEPTPTARNRRPGIWVAVLAATSLAAAGAGVWAVDAEAKTRTCDVVKELTATSGGPTPADLDRAQSALNHRIGRLLFHAGLTDAARGLTADITSTKSLRAKSLRADADVARMLAVVASINDHGRAAQRECGIPERDLFEVTSG